MWRSHARRIRIVLPSGTRRRFCSNPPPARYATVSDEDVRAIRSILHNDPSAIEKNPDALHSVNTDWTRHYKGNAELLLKPSTVDQISSILSYCNEKRLPVVPQGGNTGLVGGSVPIDNEIILSLERLNRIYGIDQLGVLRAQAGCTLHDLQEYCTHRNYSMPLDLGSKGTCQVGGNISTNAGGQYFSRYGSLAGNLLGVEVVLADGRILACRGNLKDNTGYKLHQLFVGAEGTLGVVTEVSLWCKPLPTSRQAAFLAFSAYNDVLATMDLAKSCLGEILAAFEWMDKAIVELIRSSHTLRFPLEQSETSLHYALVETHGSDESHDKEKMERFLERAIAAGLLADGVLAQDLSQARSFWKLRESANPTMASTGYTYKYDVSLPISEFENFIDVMKKQLDPLPYVCGNWGHILDGNLHFNVSTPGVYQKSLPILERLEPFLFEQVVARGGSISAEHGIGQSKNEYLTMIHDSTTLGVMQALKQMLDPNMILNPGKTLPSHHE